MDTMPRPRPLYLHRQVNRHGTPAWYIRRRGSPAIRIRGEYGTPEFTAAYEAAMAGKPAKKPHSAAAGTLEWLWAQYRKTTFWAELRPATRRQRENIMLHVLEESGKVSAAAITTKHVAAGRDRRFGTPAQARNFLDCLRGLFRWAAEAKHVPADPTVGVRNPRRKDGDGFPVWTEEEIDRYQARWPIGTKERVWIDVLLYTGLRRGDAVRLGRQHVRDGIASLRTEKSREKITVTIPILPVLAVTLAAGPTSDLAYICGEAGKPLTKETFGNKFRVACTAAGVSKSAHGLRKAGATRAAENGATVAELEAIFGWSGGAMASLYTRSADRKRLAEAAARKLERGTSYARTQVAGARTDRKT